MIKKALFATGLMLVLSITARAQMAWLNEFHYDNTGTDSNEFVEVFVSSSYSGLISDIAVTLYDGNPSGSKASYGSTSLSSFTVGSSITDYGTLYSFTYPSNGIQNGNPDGIAISIGGTLVQFLSYGGTFTASNGVASGVLSTDIGLTEASSSAVGSSLYLTGTGSSYSDFSWVFGSGVNTKGALNTSQIFTAVPEPHEYALAVAGLLGLVVVMRRRKAAQVF
jgi:hypothetical protein